MCSRADAKGRADRSRFFSPATMSRICRVKLPTLALGVLVSCPFCHKDRETLMAELASLGFEGPSFSHNSNGPDQASVVADRIAHENSSS